MIERDKICHFVIGLGATLSGLFCIYLIGTGVLWGIAKELYDKYAKKTVFDWVDLNYTLAGCLVGMIIILVTKI